MNLLTWPIELGATVLTRLILVPLRPAIKQIIHEEAGHYLTDIEWRYKQARDILNEVGRGNDPEFNRQMTAEDMNLLRHEMTGYTVTNNVDNAGAALVGSIRWQALHVVYAGFDYLITDGASSLKYHTFVKPGSPVSPVAMVSSNTKPTLGKDDMLLFINNGGVAVVAGSSGQGSLPAAVADGIIDTTSLTSAFNTSLNNTNTQANLGVTNAGIAQTQATLGVTNAGTAQTAANTAQTQANLGVTNAATAQTQATLGVTNASTAQTAANTAQTQANLGVTNAGIAQTQANLGVTNAATAQTAATTSIIGPGRLNILSHIIW